MSARAFYEPLYVIDFIRQYLNLRDPHRGLADQDRAKVLEDLLIFCCLCSDYGLPPQFKPLKYVF